MRVSCAGRSRGALEAALAAYPQVDLREPTTDLEAPTTSRTARTVRARLILARPAREALGEAGLQPDLLQGIAAAVAGLDPGRGEQARLVLDVRPLAAGRVRRRLLGERHGQGLAVALAGEPRRGRMSAGETIERRHDTQGLDRKLAPQHPLLQFQLCLRVAAVDRQRALETTRSVVAVLDVLGAANHLRVRGLRLGGLGFLGQDLERPLRNHKRRCFDGPGRDKRVQTLFQASRQLAQAHEAQALEQKRRRRHVNRREVLEPSTAAGGLAERHERILAGLAQGLQLCASRTAQSGPEVRA
jgi:hypothetical protein